MKRSNSSGSNSMLTFISVLIIVAFLVASGLLVVPHVQKLMNDKAMRNGEKEPTVEFLAKEQNMSVEDFLAQYGLTVNETVKADTVASEMVQNMTIGNYNKYVGEQNAIDLSQFTDAVNENTLYKDFIAMPAKTVLGDEMFENTKKTYGVGDEVNDETSWQDFQQAMYNAYSKQQQEGQAAGTDAANAQTTAPAATAAPAE